MSRIGKKPIIIPKGVTVTVNAEALLVKGPKGDLSYKITPLVQVVQDGGTIKLSVARPERKEQRSQWGTDASIIKSMIKGVQDGYQKQLEISGTGFKVAAQGQTLTLSIGFSHPVVYELPKGIAVSIEKNTITLNGIDKQLVGETAAQIRRLRPPDAYKGKGIRIVGEIIKLKPGKQAKATAAAA